MAHEIVASFRFGLADWLPTELGTDDGSDSDDTLSSSDQQSSDHWNSDEEDDGSNTDQELDFDWLSDDDDAVDAPAAQVPPQVLEAPLHPEPQTNPLPAEIRPPNDERAYEFALVTHWLSIRSQGLRGPGAGAALEAVVPAILTGERWPGVDYPPTLGVSPAPHNRLLASWADIVAPVEDRSWDGAFVVYVATWLDPAEAATQPADPLVTYGVLGIFRDDDEDNYSLFRPQSGEWSTSDSADVGFPTAAHALRHFLSLEHPPERNRTSVPITPQLYNAMTLPFQVRYVSMF